jgi:aarF domain-containing kinase
MSRSLLLDAAQVLKGASMVLTEMARLQPQTLGKAAATNLPNLQDVVATPPPPTTRAAPATPANSKPMQIVNGADLQPVPVPEDLLHSNSTNQVIDDDSPSHHPSDQSHRANTDTATTTNTNTNTNTNTINTNTNTNTNTATPPSTPSTPSTTNTAPPPTPQEHRPQQVPSTQLSRVFGFGGLATRLALGTVGELVRRQFDQIAEDNTKRAVLSDGNMDVLASTLCRMRGAALKLGQMLSMADNNLIPKELTEALDRVRQHADRMPEPQLNQTMATELGDDWKEQFVAFQDLPLAAASLGQVHRATRYANEAQNEAENEAENEAQNEAENEENLHQVVVKVQYPGVADSIDSDIENVMRLVRWTNFAPPGLYIDEVMRVARKELKLECDYVHEALMQKQYHALLNKAQNSTSASSSFHQFFNTPGVAASDELLSTKNNVSFVVPRVYEDMSTSRVLTSEYVSGIPLDEISSLEQTTRDDVGGALLWLTMTELFDWNFMQTDPNWGNFLYDVDTSTIGLIDFGAARPFDSAFTDQYLRLVWGSANNDETMVLDASVKLGFLTGDESKPMVQAHLAAAYAIGEPFSTYEPFAFRDSNLTERVTSHLQVFGKERLKPPPEDACKFCTMWLRCCKRVNGFVGALGTELLCSSFFCLFYFFLALCRCTSSKISGVVHGLH